MTIRVAILGAMGRMGRAVTAALGQQEDKMVPALAGEWGEHSDLGQPYLQTGLILEDAAKADLASSDVVIDFSAPGSTALHARRAADAGVAYVVGTTGLSDEDEATLEAAADGIAVVQAGNFSLGVNVLLAATELVAAALGEDWDIEILEMHHRNKIDSPSGTALMLGEAAARARGVALDEVSERGRDGLHGARIAGDIGFASMRGGAVVGEHEIVFASDAERVTLSHKAENRDLFAAGALKAARFAAKAGRGRYSMRDVLAL